jgi:hypothetical protein
MENTLSNWEITETPLFANFKQVNGYKAIMRSDTNEILHIAKSTYTPTPNKLFIETANTLSKITNYPLEMVTEVEKGKKTLAFLKVTDPMRIGGNDFNEYLMIGNSHDGSTGFFIGNSSIMVRCSNRFSKKFRQMQVYHTANHHERINDIIDSFGDYRSQRSKFIDTLGEYVDFEIIEDNKREIVNLIAEVTPLEIEKPDTLSTRKKNIIADIQQSIEIETKALGNNLFGLFNGITHYTTHTRKTKEKVFCNAIGTANEVNQKAFNFCNALINQ